MREERKRKTRITALKEEEGREDRGKRWEEEMRVEEAGEKGVQREGGKMK